MEEHFTSAAPVFDTSAYSPGFFQSTPNHAPLVDADLQHIAFIMDGNGRWAQKRGKPRQFGHTAGAQRFRDVTRYCGTIGVKYLTFYAFSTENWKRPRVEIQAIMRLFRKYLLDAFEEAKNNNMVIHILGDRSVFSPSLQNLMNDVEKQSASNTGTVVNMAMNYGSRAEIVHAVNTLLLAGKTSVTEEDITAALYTAHCPPPDMIVRTGGELRLSNFLLWQSAYAELYFTDTLWPDLTNDDINGAITDFYHRKRRFGGV